MLIPDKSEAIWCTTSRRQHQLPTATIPIVGVPITPARSVRDVGIYIDADLSMPAHVKRTVSQCFAALRQLRQIRRAVPTATFQMFVVALVHTRLDYGNTVLVGMPAHLVRRLQSGSTRLHDSSTICDRTTTSLMRWRQCCASQNACSTKSRC